MIAVGKTNKKNANRGKILLSSMVVSQVVGVKYCHR